jgi:hypothetical protein
VCKPGEKDGTRRKVSDSSITPTRRDGELYPRIRRRCRKRHWADDRCDAGDRHGSGADQRGAPHEVPAVDTGRSIKKVEFHELADSARCRRLIDSRGGGDFGESVAAGARIPYPGYLRGQAVCGLGAPVED